MKKRKLSLLQEEYQKFFKQRLKDFNVDSPAVLDLEEKRTFFKGIPRKWRRVKKDLAENGNLETEASVESREIINKEYLDTSDISYIVSSVRPDGTVELVQLENASDIIQCSAYDFKHCFSPVSVTAMIQADDDSPLNIALIETSEVVATLNSLLRTALKSAPEEVKIAAREAVKAAKLLLQKLATEVRED